MTVRNDRWMVVAALTLAVALVVVLAGCGSGGSSGSSGDDDNNSSSEAEAASAPEPTPDDVAQAFMDNELEVGNYYHVEDDPEWGTGALPKTMDSGTRVELPTYTMGTTPAHADVFHFATADDQKVVSDYLGTLNKSGGGMFYTHTYETNGFLLKIDGNVPKPVADQYGAVLTSNF